MPAENDSSSTALYTLWASPLLVISLYNYNFCGYERGLAAHFSYLSPTAEAGHRIASSSLIADIIGFYSGTSLSLYLMHTYIRVFEPRRRYFFLIGKFRKRNRWWWLSFSNFLGTGFWKFWKKWRKGEFVRFWVSFEIVGNVIIPISRRILKLCETNDTCDLEARFVGSFSSRKERYSYDFFNNDAVCKFVYFRVARKFMRLWRATVEHFPTVNVTLLVTWIRAHAHALPFSISPFFIFPIHRPGANWIFPRAVCHASKFRRAAKCKNANVNVRSSEAKIKSEGLKYYY